MKFKKPFRGVPDGEIYPVEYQPGDECPPELLPAAVALGAVESPEGEVAKPLAPAAAALAPKPARKK